MPEKGMHMRYSGAMPWRPECVMVTNRRYILALIGSHCEVFKRSDRAEDPSDGPVEYSF